ncbi:MAG: hypothetical protein IC227_00345 [Enterococcus lacertideformus]|uniref:Uncharacterized protein n=1 Tax=Enterococcus lacertideformus TaxID=2771493 RepID=A0A931AU70_9ENTE|nr:hypothetical protein [Enterococcus lacertideformus]
MPEGTMNGLKEDLKEKLNKELIGKLKDRRMKFNGYENKEFNDGLENTIEESTSEAKNKVQNSQENEERNYDDVYDMDNLGNEPTNDAVDDPRNKQEEKPIYATIHRPNIHLGGITNMEETIQLNPPEKRRNAVEMLL